MHAIAQRSASETRRRTLRSTPEDFGVEVAPIGPSVHTQRAMAAAYRDGYQHPDGMMPARFAKDARLSIEWKKGARERRADVAAGEIEPASDCAPRRRRTH